MRVHPATVLGDAWALFRRDRDVLIRIAGPCLFLPQLALGLLVPGIPAIEATAGDDPARTEAWFQAFGAWLNAYGGWYLLGLAVGQFAVAAIYAWHLDPRRPTVAEAFGRAATLLPRVLLAQALIGIPAGAGLLLFVVPTLYVLARTLPVGPLLVAERPVGAIRAIARGFALGRGATLPLMALAAIPYGAGWIAEQPFLALDRWMRGTGVPNPVALAIVESGAAGVAAAAGLAQALLALAVYRRLASSGS